MQANFKTFGTIMAPIEGHFALNLKAWYYLTLVLKLINPPLSVSVISGRNLVFVQVLDLMMPWELLLCFEHSGGKLGLHHVLSQSTTPFRSTLPHQISIRSTGPPGLDWRWLSAKGSSFKTELKLKVCLKHFKLKIIRVRNLNVPWFIFIVQVFQSLDSTRIYVCNSCRRIKGTLNKILFNAGEERIKKLHSIRGHSRYV